MTVGQEAVLGKVLHFSTHESATITAEHPWADSLSQRSRWPPPRTTTTPTPTTATSVVR